MNLEIISKFPESPAGHPPLLFVHGAYVGAWVWNHGFLDYFAEEGYECHAVSLRGHGLSPGFENLCAWGISDYVHDVRDAIRRLSAPPVLIGHSMGGFIIQQFMEREESNIAGFVLMATVPPDGLFQPVAKNLTIHPVLLYKLNIINTMPQWMWEYWITPEEIQKLFLSMNTPIDLVKNILPKLQPESPRAILDMSFSNNTKSRPGNKPVLVLGAEDDMIIPAEFAEKTAKTFGADLEVIPRIGHAMMLETEWDLTAEAISKWLKANSL